MSANVRNLSLRRQPPQPLKQRPSRAYQERKPGPDDDGELGEDQSAAPTADQDRAFQGAMQQALDRRQENMPPVIEHHHDSVPMRRHVPGQVLTASNLEN